MGLSGSLRRRDIAPSFASLAVVAVIAACTRSSHTTPDVFAVAETQTVDVAAEAPALGALVRVELPDLDTAYRPRLVLDADGRAGLAGPRGPVTLPFSGPVREVHLYRADLCCARTAEDGLECLFAHGQLEGQIRGDRGVSDGVHRLRFPTLSGRVARLLPGYEAPCFEPMEGRAICAPLSSSGFGPEERFFLTAPRAAESVAAEVATRRVDLLGRDAEDPPETTCGLHEGQVRCRGPGIYGERGDGDTSEAVRETTVPGLEGAIELVSGDRWVCARTEGGDPWCWGAVPRSFPVAEREGFYRHPACRFDQEASEALRNRRVADDARAVEACLGRTCIQGQLDCHLGCTPSDIPHELVFDRRELCEVPVIPNQDGSRWPTLEELAASYTRVELAVRPTRLAIPPVISMAGRRDELCVVDGGGSLHCWSA